MRGYPIPPRTLPSAALRVCCPRTALAGTVRLYSPQRPMSTIMVLSDIHANLEALEAVFDHVAKTYGRPNRIWCLGDLVGYGPDPGPCVDRLTTWDGVPIDCICGNHDEGVLQVERNALKMETSREVIAGWEWAAAKLSGTQKQFLAALPPKRIYTDLPQPVLLVHAAPPENREQYLLTAKDVEAVLDKFEQRICFFGHTHMACYFECWPEDRKARPRLFSTEMSTPVEIKSPKIFLNPGAVGQPRWGRLTPWLPRDAQGGYPLNFVGVSEASYLWVEILADAVRVTCHYVAYPFDVTVQKLKALASASPRLEVPQRWVDRLSEGLR